MEIHFSCLGSLCNVPVKHTDFKNKEEYLSKFTLNPQKVTCSKCIEILKKQNILR